MVEDALRTARRPQVSNPQLTRRREVHLERVTLRPQAPELTKKRWRAGPVATAGAVLAIITAVPLTHAAGPDPIDRLEPTARDSVAIVVPPGIDVVGHAVVAIVPEPLAQPADEALYVKVDGAKDNPYVAARPRLVKRSRPFEPARMSELKANPYEGRASTPRNELKSNPYD